MSPDAVQCQRDHGLARLTAKSGLIIEKTARKTIGPLTR